MGACMNRATRGCDHFFSSPRRRSRPESGRREEKRASRGCRAGASYGRQGQRRPDDRKALLAALKKRLLDHSLKSADDDKLRRAKHAFAQP